VSHKKKHLGPDELLNAVEEIGDPSPHAKRCRRCRREIEGFQKVVVLLRRIWHPGPIVLPAAHIVLADAKRLHLARGRLFSATVGWFVLLLIASGLVYVSDTFMPQISEGVVSLHAGIGTAGMLALIVILLGLAVSPVVVLLGETRGVERSFVQ
jgi:hypothetical protein